MIPERERRFAFVVASHPERTEILPERVMRFEFAVAREPEREEISRVF